MQEIINILYVYCTDFIINLANVTDLSYYEVNAVVFCLLYPILLFLLPFLYLVQRFRLSSVKGKIQNNIEHMD